MKAVVRGQVVEVTPREYVDKAGKKQQTWDGYLASDNPRYGAQRISGAAEVMPKPGDHIELEALITARSGDFGPWLSVFCVAPANVAA